MNFFKYILHYKSKVFLDDSLIYQQELPKKLRLYCRLINTHYCEIWSLVETVYLSNGVFEYPKWTSVRK